MPVTLPQILRALNSRLARNLCFWGIVVIPPAVSATSGPQLFFTLMLFAWLILLFLLNNFWLVPRLLARRRYWSYAAALIGLTFLIAGIYASTLKLMLHYFPRLKVSDVSYLTSYSSGTLSPGAFLEEALEYFPILFFVALIFTGAWYVVDYVRQQRQMEKIKKQQAETELHFLRTQISPHFLFNTLNNIYGLAGKKSDLTQEMILRLSDILRYLLYESNVALISFEKEKQIMESYIELETLQLPDTRSMSFTIEADGPYQLPPLLWLTVLENVFKHGTRMISDNYQVSFVFSIRDHTLRIASRNTYKPRLLKRAGHGIGLKNLEKRLALLYPGRHTLHTQHENGQFITEIQITL